MCIVYGLRLLLSVIVIVMYCVFTICCYVVLEYFRIIIGDLLMLFNWLYVYSDIRSTGEVPARQLLDIRLIIFIWKFIILFMYVYTWLVELSLMFAAAGVWLLMRASIVCSCVVVDFSCGIALDTWVLGLKRISCWRAFGSGEGWLWVRLTVVWLVYHFFDVVILIYVVNIISCMTIVFVFVFGVNIIVHE